MNERPIEKGHHVKLVSQQSKKGGMKKNREVVEEESYDKSPLNVERYKLNGAASQNSDSCYEK